MVPLGLVDHVGDRLLTLLQPRHQRLPGELGQHQQQHHEHDEREPRQVGIKRQRIDAVGRRPAASAATAATMPACQAPRRTVAEVTMFVIFMAIRRLQGVESESGTGRDTPHIYWLNNMQMINAKNVAPSISAAEINIAV